MSALLISMFLLGLVTSVHCVAMCGPMVVTYAVKGGEGGDSSHGRLVPNIAYQSAKIVSYVIVGLLLGAIGSVFNLANLRPYVMAFAGVFMIVMGLGMTGKAPWAARLTPRPPKVLTHALRTLRHRANDDADSDKGSLATPVMFGLLSGLMPCAPLQAAQISAAAAGSALGGGASMLAFGLGTAPLLFAFGTASGLLPMNLKKRLMVALSVVVIVFGVVYVNRAAMLLGSPVTASSVQQSVSGLWSGSSVAAASASVYNTGDDGVVEIPVTIDDTTFSPEVVQIPSDTPVRLVVDRQESSACSDQLAIPQLGVLADLASNAVTTIDVPASKSGTYTLTCGMGMMSGKLVVTSTQS